MAKSMTMEKIGMVVEVNFKLSLWQAIKLRIAGKAYKEAVEVMVREMKEKQEEVK